MNISILYLKKRKKKSFNLIQISEERKRDRKMNLREKRFNDIYEIIENRIDSNESKNSFDKKFLEIQRDSEREFRIFINEEYYMRDIKIEMNEDYEIIISEYESEENQKYIRIFSINMILYENNNYHFKNLKKMIINMINDLLLFYDDIKI